MKRSAAFSRAEVFHWPAYERAANERLFGERLRKAVDRTERLFRRIEALRVSLAKHELPGVTGSFAMAPGYGRIDMGDGSIYWQLVLRGNEIDMVSRRRIADDCLRLGSNNHAVILTEQAQEKLKLKNIPDFSYGVKRIVIILDDSTEYPGVYVAWRKEILRVTGHDVIPFDAKRIVDVRNDPVSGQEQSLVSP